MHSRRTCCCMLALFLTKKNPVGAVSIRRNVTSKMSSSLSYRALDTVESTQDTARMLLHQNSVKTPFLAISAKQQSQGRGTSGRIWKGITGNVFLTVAFSMDRVPVSVTLLPLQVGILIATTLQQVLTKICHESTATIRLKWPNDVLVNQKKVAGVLIESELVNDTTYLLVGIGINIQQAPQIPSNEGRQAACLQEFCTEKLPEQTAEIVAADLANHLVEWMEADGRKDVIQEWKKWADFGTPQTLRDTGERVVPLSIQEDGQLRVRLENGQERLLMAEYLY